VLPTAGDLPCELELEFLMPSCAWWTEMMAAYRSGGSAQKTADKNAATQEAANALQDRAKVDDAARATGDAANDDALRRWDRPD
jgi:hypothetical protein